MSTEVASRIGRVRRSLHDRRKKGRERKARNEKRPLSSLPNSPFFLPPIPLLTLSSPPPVFFDTYHTGCARSSRFAHVFAGFSLS